VTRGLYLAAAGMALQLQKQDVYANNLANASTVGYRRADLAVGSFQQTLRQAQQASPSRLPGNEASIVDLSPGPVHGPGLSEDTAVRQGFVEEANVSVVREMSRMMTGFRAFEASAVALRLQDQTLGILIDSVGK